MSDATKRTKLEHFPCGLDLMRGDWGETCESTARETCELAWDCTLLPIYEQAIAHYKCARVLLAIKRWWWDKHYWPDIFVGVKGDPGSMRIVRFRNWMNAALRQAGL